MDWSLAPSLARPSPGDFDAYFALGKHMVEGVRVYDDAAILALQSAIGRGEDYANLVWYAPHVLPLFCLFGLLPYVAAWPTWLALQMALLFVAVDRLWALAQGPQHKRHYPALFAVAFYPTLALAVWRQASALLLIGLVGFLALKRARRDFAAGACLALVAIKPQLAYVVWLGIALWVVRSRRFRVLLGLVFTAAVGSAVAFALNPAFFRAYVHHLVHRPPDFLSGPSLGGQLRLIFGANHYALQFVPALGGLAWFGATLRNRWRCDFEDQLPALLSASFIFSVFYWTPDLVLLLAWMIPTLARLARDTKARTLQTFLGSTLTVSAVVLVAHEFFPDSRFYALAVVYAAMQIHFTEHQQPGWWTRQVCAASTTSS